MKRIKIVVLILFLFLAFQSLYSCNKNDFELTEIKSWEKEKFSKLLYPQPQFQELGNLIKISGNFVFEADETLKTSNGFDAIERLVKSLSSKISDQDKPENIINFELLEEDKLKVLLNRRYTDYQFTASQLQQAYILDISKTENNVKVSVQASSIMGCFYGCLTLTQLVLNSMTGLLPETKIMDWPSVDFRMSKLVGNTSFDPDVNLLPFLRMNYLGVQYHVLDGKGKDIRPSNYKEEYKATFWAEYGSKNLQPPYESNLRKYILENKMDGLLNVVPVYGPFLGDSFIDFKKQEVRELYLNRFLQWLDIGAKGVWIDINDWFFEDIQSDWTWDQIVNFIYQGIKEKYPEYPVLFCPANYTTTKEKYGYRGPVNWHYEQILNNIPEDVKVIYTGPIKNASNVGWFEPPWTYAQAISELDLWIEKAGRKPYWFHNLNGSSWVKINNNDNNKAFSGTKWFPEDVETYFSGVHWNHSMLRGYKLGEELRFTLPATFIDYFWNSDAYNPEQAFERSYHYLTKILPYLIENIFVIR